MQAHVPLPAMKGFGKVIEKKATKYCIGCLNISAGNSPIGFYRDKGIGNLDAEHQWFDLDGKRRCDITIHFCPVCGRSLKELAQDPNYSHRRST